MVDEDKINDDGKNNGGDCRVVNTHYKSAGIFYIHSANDDYRWARGLMKSKLFQENNNGMFYDGGMTNHFRLGYTDSGMEHEVPVLGRLNSYDVHLSNTMYTPYRWYNDTYESPTLVYDKTQRPSVGVTEVSGSTQFENKFKFAGSKFYDQTIISGNVNYHDTGMTSEIHSWWHHAFGVEQPTYKANPAKTGLGGSISVSKNLTYEMLYGMETNIWLNANAGLTYGDFSGANVGFGIQAGNMRKTQVVEKTEQPDTTHYNFSKNKFNWNVSADYNCSFVGHNSVLESTYYSHKTQSKENKTTTRITNSDSWIITEKSGIVNSFNLGTELSYGRFLLGAGVTVATNVVSDSHSYTERELTITKKSDGSQRVVNSSNRLPSSTPKVNVVGELKIGFILDK